MSANVMFGTISCLADTTNHLAARVEMHRAQLDFLESITERMIVEHGETPLPYYRVEQGWSAERKKYLHTSLLTEADVFETPIPPGAARNVLLRRLYESDKDWLICMDDDHALCDRYHGYELFWELSSPKFLNLAKEGYMIMAFPAYWNGYSKEVAKWGHSDTDWLLKRTRHPGAMPFACIPNIAKYGKPLVFFDEETTASTAGEVPEDLRFMIDWVGNGGRWVECVMLIGRCCGALDKSSIFTDHATRVDKIQADTLWATQYLKEKYPRNPRLWMLKEFMKRKNPSITLNIPRRYRHDSE